MARFREIERLRGLAILLAVFNHAPLVQLVPGYCGVIGVHLFFVISGFVITLSLLRLERLDPRPLMTFYRRRAFRILPLVLASIALALACSTWLNATPAWDPPARLARQAVAALTLNYNYRTYTLGWDLVWLWSLNVEEHFYLVFPILALAAVRGHSRRDGLRRLAWGLSLAWLGATAVRLATAADYERMIPYWTNHFATHARLDTLIAGAGLAVIHELGLFERPSPSREMRAAGQALAWTAIAALVGVPCLAGGLDRFVLTVVELASVTLVALASVRRQYVLAPGALGAVFEWLGQRSYAIYLFHVPAWRIVYELLAPQAHLRATLGVAGQITLFVAYALVLAEIAHRSIERPLIAWGRRGPGSRAAEPATTRKAA